MVIMVHDGQSFAIRPVHNPLVGDIVFLLATRGKALSENTNLDLTRIGLQHREVHVKVELEIHLLEASLALDECCEHAQSANSSQTALSST